MEITYTSQIYENEAKATKKIFLEQVTFDPTQKFINPSQLYFQNVSYNQKTTNI